MPDGKNMRRSYLLITIVASLLIHGTDAGAAAEKTGSWAYLYHGARLSAEDLARSVPRFDVICVSGFILDQSGELQIRSKRTMEEVLKIAAGHRVTCYPMVTFTSAAQGRRILASPRLIKASVATITAMARRGGYPGVHLDFEYLPPEDAPKLAEFLSAFRASFKGKITMAVFPPIEFPEKWNRFHDLTLIAPHVDEIVIMCYDLHGAHTGPGPVTDAGWAERNIRFALRHMAKGRVWLGIPAYGYRWCGGKARAISAREGMKIAENQTYTRDPSGTVHFTTSASGRRCEAYLSDRKTRSILKQLATRYGLAGTAIWRLGFED